MVPFSPSAPFNERFAEAVEGYCETGASQKDLAIAIGCSENMIGHWKAGRHMPKGLRAEGISRVLGLRVEEEGDRGGGEAESSAAADPLDLLGRLSELELESILEEVGPRLRQFDALIPDLMDLLAGAKRYVEEAE